MFSKNGHCHFECEKEALLQPDFQRRSHESKWPLNMKQPEGDSGPLHVIKE